MKVLQINIFGNLSTGRIAVDLYRTLVKNGYYGKIAFARNTIAKDIPYIKIGNKASVCVDGIMTRITDRAGFFSGSATKKLIFEIEDYNPDIIHLHNIHGYYVNVEILFQYLAKCNKPVVWTLHDCWAYTGHCCYYSMIGCMRWKQGCYSCPQKHSYPSSLLIDNCVWNYKKKKDLFTSVPNLHLVTVSKWLASEVKQSFLSNLPCSVIYNGIDTSIFKPTSSNFRSKYGIENKFIILGVASTWDARKHLQDFIDISQKLDDSYKVVVVGVNDLQKKRLPTNMIALSRTDSLEELAGIYSTADVFFNASVEETFGLPTVESIACGTPAIVYNSTALPEVITKDNGCVVSIGNIDAVIDTIIKIKEGKKSFCFKHFQFSKENYYKKYIELYKSILL